MFIRSSLYNEMDKSNGLMDAKGITEFYLGIHTLKKSTSCSLYMPDKNNYSYDRHCWSFSVPSFPPSSSPGPSLGYHFRQAASLMRLPAKYLPTSLRYFWTQYKKNDQISDPATLNRLQWTFSQCSEEQSTITV